MEKVLIPGYTSYFITKTGKILSSPNIHHKKIKEIKLQKGRKGRNDDIMRVRIPADNKWYQVHKLVAEVFIPQPEGLNDVKWKDGDKSNNSVDNLEWYYNPSYKSLNGISSKAYAWSKWGGKLLGLVQENKTDEWACQACGEIQGSELPSYMFEFLNNEFIRICSVCQSVKHVNKINNFTMLLQIVR